MLRALLLHSVFIGRFTNDITYSVEEEGEYEEEYAPEEEQ